MISCGRRQGQETGQKKQAQTAPKAWKGFPPPNRGTVSSAGATHGEEWSPLLCSLVSPAGNTTEFHSLLLDAEGSLVGGRSYRPSANCIPNSGTSRFFLREIRETRLQYCLWDWFFHCPASEILKLYSPLPSFAFLPCVLLYSSSVCSLIVKPPLYFPSFSAFSWVRLSFQTSEARQSFTSFFSQ